MLMPPDQRTAFIKVWQREVEFREEWTKDLENIIWESKHWQSILNYKRLCPCVCLCVCHTGLDWIISDLNTPSLGSDTDINI